MGRPRNPALANQRKIAELNTRITNLRMDQCNQPAQTKTQLTELQQRLQPTVNTQQQAQIRRDSNSTVSSYYGSMRSADMSRKSSLASQVSFLLRFTLHLTVIQIIGWFLRNCWVRDWIEMKQKFV